MRNPTLVVLAALFVAVAVFASACSQNATLVLHPGQSAPAGSKAQQRKDGKIQIVGRVLGSDEASVTVAGKADGTTVVVPRDRIEVIEHPGQIDGWVGVGMLGGGALVATIGGIAIAVCEPEDETVDDSLDPRCLAFGSIAVLVGVGAAIAGAVMVPVGFTTYADSRKAAGETAGWTIEPTLATRRLGTVDAVEAGAAITVRW